VSKESLDGTLSGRGNQPLALTMGDPSGIGPEITLAAWARRHSETVPPFAVFADPALLAELAAMLGLDAPIAEIDQVADARSHFAAKLPVVPVFLPAEARPSAPDPANAPAIIASIDKAVDAVRRGQAAAVVTNPISKAILYAADFKHPGHTEYLATLADMSAPEVRHTPVMMLACAELRVVPLTVHIPLAEVASAITGRLIDRTVRIVASELQISFGILTPRIAVAGLNPHAGEGGNIGREELEIISPALERLRSEGLLVSGAHSADTLFHESARQRYDAAIAMYHDQALIPIKTLAFDRGVNVTLGLPFVRTSPDHGTAFDIAGQGIASAVSLIEALKLAAEMASRRSSLPAGPPS
jgi:4-hydroxythreonine-4-phosphate dehydrogenase